MAGFRNTVREQWSSLEGPTFLATLQDSRALTRWATSWHEHCLNDMGVSIQNVPGELQEAMPPMKLIQDPRLLTDKSLQTQLFNNPSRALLNPKTRELGNMLQQVKDGQNKGLTLNKDLKQIHKEASTTRSDAKLCIVVDWTIDKMVREKPGDPQAMKKQGDEIFRQAFGQ